MFLQSELSTLTSFVESYGWFLLIGGIVVFYLVSRLKANARSSGRGAVTRQEEVRHESFSLSLLLSSLLVLLFLESFGMPCLHYNGL